MGEPDALHKSTVLFVPEALTDESACPTPCRIIKIINFCSHHSAAFFNEVDEALYCWRSLHSACFDLLSYKAYNASTGRGADIGYRLVPDQIIMWSSPTRCRNRKCILWEYTCENTTHMSSSARAPQCTVECSEHPSAIELHADRTINPSDWS